eukprot:RCo007894
MPKKGENRNVAELFIQSPNNWEVDVDAEVPREKKVLPEELKAKLKGRKALAAGQLKRPLEPETPSHETPEVTEGAGEPEPELEPASSSTSSNCDLRGCNGGREKMASGDDFVSFDDKAHDDDDLGQPQNVLPQAPWVRRTYQHLFRDNHMRLHEEIVDWIAYMRPRPAEHALRRVLVNRLVDLLTRSKDALFPEAKCHVFGSLRTGLLLPSSDVDLCVTGVTSCSIRDALNRISARLETLELCLEKPKVIDARVSVVKFTDRTSKILCDVSVNSIGGRHNTHMVKRLLAKYPQATPLILIIKTFLRQRVMNEVYTGGLSSYSISLMVIHLLQMFYGPSAHRDKPSLGKLLIDFFQLYGFHFNYDLAAISVRGRGCYLSKAEFQDGVNQAALKEGRPIPPSPRSVGVRL